MIRFSRLCKTATIAGISLLHCTAFATERAWSGGGGSDNINDSGNWFNGTPNSGDDLKWDNTTGIHHFSYFNYGDYYQFGHLNVYSGAGDGQWYGNALKFTDYVKNNSDSNQWRVYNSNVSARALSGSTIYVIGDSGGFYFKLDGSGGTGSGSAGHFFLDTLTLEVQGGGGVILECSIANGNGTGNLTMNNSNTVSLAGTTANTYSGTTTVTQGTLLLNKTAGVDAIGGSSIQVNGGALQLNASNQIKDTTPMTLNGGRFNTGGNSEYTGTATAPTAGIGALTLSSNSIIDMGSAASIIAFENSSGKSWTGTLSIYNWSGIPILGDGTDQIFFGTDATGLTQSQLNSIRFYTDNGTTFLGTGRFAIDGLSSDGEVVPVPEPSTWAAGILALAAMGCSQRRRFSRLLNLA